MAEHYLTEERRMIQDVAREFTRKEVLPVANELDPVQGYIPMDLRNKLGEMGYFGIRMAEEHGGMGLGVFEYCLISETGPGWMSVASIIARSSSLYDVAGWLRGNAGHSREGSRGHSPVTLSEPTSVPTWRGELPRGTRRRQLGDHGQQVWCTFRRGAIHPASGPVDGDDPEFKGLQTFIIEKNRGELPEGCTGAPIPKIGYFGWNTFELAFDGCRIPRENIVTSGRGGFRNTVNFLNAARAHTASRAIGLARGALEDAMAYSQERVQFGVPIADFQETRFKIARMASEVEAARQLMYHACTLMDNGETADREAAMVKWYASEMAERVTSDALQILGGAGYTKLHAVERYWRDARLTKIFEGTSEIQLRIISDRLLGRPTSRNRA